MTLREILLKTKREAIHVALLATAGKAQEAARMLGLNRTSFHNLCKDLEVKPALYREPKC